jgi:hypothetical protein
VYANGNCDVILGNYIVRTQVRTFVTKNRLYANETYASAPDPREHTTNNGQHMCLNAVTAVSNCSDTAVLNGIHIYILTVAVTVTIYIYICIMY